MWKNTDVGDLWEERNTVADETELLKRAEKYPENADLPGEPGCGPLILTCGVDFQHKYAQYEIVGWGHYYESWGYSPDILPGLRIQTRCGNSWTVSFPVPTSLPTAELCGLS